LTLDNIKGVDVVTADGKLLHASAGENPDLYWGVRGGGGNFGIVTSFQYALHPMQRQVIGGEVVFPLDRARDLIRFYADFSVQAPDDLYIDFYINATASGEGSGAGFHICYSGPEKDAERVLAPVRKLGEPAFTNLGPIDYVAIQRSWDYSDFRNIGEYLKAGFVNEYPDSMLDAAAAGFEASPDRNTMLYFQQSGGAIGRVPVDATAFPHRRAESNMMILTSWPLGTDGSPHIDYLRDYWNTIKPRTDGYYTVDSATESSQVRHGNYQGNFPRLLQVKKKYRPEGYYWADQPPSIGSIAPVIDAAASPQRKMTSSAISSIWTNFLVGCAASMTSRTTSSSVMPRTRAVSATCPVTSGVST
jgi:hypothetical protein